jgi:hypothetical protein
MAVAATAVLGTRCVRADHADKMKRPSRAMPHLVRPQRSVTAEEAVTNILYNTPPPSTEPFKRYAHPQLGDSVC